MAFPRRTMYDNDGRERVSDISSLSPHAILGSEKNSQAGDRTRDSGCRYPAGNVEESSSPTQPPESEPYTYGQLLMTDRKKSKPRRPAGSSCVRVTMCLPGLRLVFDHSNCWVIIEFLLAVNRCGVELSIDTLKKPWSKPPSL